MSTCKIKAYCQTKRVFKLIFLMTLSWTDIEITKNVYITSRTNNITIFIYEFWISKYKKVNCLSEYYVECT